jgi:hypothetical protein
VAERSPGHSEISFGANPLCRQKSEPQERPHFRMQSATEKSILIIWKHQYGGNMLLTIPIPEGQETVHLPAGTLDWSEEEFFQFCQANRDLRIERSAKGEIIVMSPAGGYSGFRSGKVFSQLEVWASKDGTGVAFDSSTGFRLPMAPCGRRMLPGCSFRGSKN